MSPTRCSRSRRRGHGSGRLLTEGPPSPAAALGGGAPLSLAPRTRPRQRCALRRRRAQHRLGGDERAHLRGGGVRRGRQDHDLRRRGVGRRLEVARRGHHLQAGLRQAAVQSIGAIAIDPSNTKTVWVGTGEAWTRNSVSIGDGIYKSTDGGATWTNMGLPESERISPDPREPGERRRRVCVRPGEALERQRRSRRLQDHRRRQALVAHPEGDEPLHRLLAVSRWTRRTPTCSSPARGTSAARGGPSAPGATGPDAPSGSALYRTADGGQDLDADHLEANKGLPAKPWGRVEVAVAPSDPKVVYAFIESKDSALYPLGRWRGDLGAARHEPEHGVAPVLLRAPRSSIPTNPDRLFKPDLSLIVSEDGGRELREQRRRLPRRLARPLDRSDEPEAHHRRRRRRALDVVRRRQPLVEVQQPSDLAILSRERRRQGPVPRLRRAAGQQLVGRRLVVPGGHHEPALGEPLRRRRLLGDGRPDRTRTPSTPSPRGATSVASTGRTLANRDIQPTALYKEKLRFNWNTPIAREPHGEGDDLHRRAVSLPVARPRRHVGPHLARPDHERPGEAEAGGVGRRHRRQLVGRDAHDDLLDQRVAEGLAARSGWEPTTATSSSPATPARRWTNVVANVTGLPRASWVSWVEASRFDAATAYAAFDRHTFGDMTPWVYRTTDFGKTWTRIVGPWHRACAATPTSSRRTRSSRRCSSSAPSSVFGSRSTEGRTGRSSRGAISRAWRCATSRCRRARTTS